MGMKFWLWKNFVGYVMLDHGKKFCGYDFGRVGIFCCDWTCRSFWLLWTCKNFWFTHVKSFNWDKILVGHWFFFFFGSLILWSWEIFVGMEWDFLLAWKFWHGLRDFLFFVGMWFLAWNNGLNFCVVEPQESR